MSEDMAEKVARLEEHVLGLGEDKPGLVLRVYKLEWFMRMLVATVGLGVGWKVLDVIQAFLASRLTPP